MKKPVADSTSSRAFEITFLGTGTSVGVPMIGCDCDVCHSSDPRDKRDRASIAITTPEQVWIVDTGPDFRHQCLREGIRRLDAVLLTHSHTDHIIGFDDVRRFTIGADQVMPVYGTPACLAALGKVFEFAFNGENRYVGYLKPDPRPIDGPFVIGPTTITPLPVLHGKVPTIGYLFEREGRKLAAYLPDVKSVPESTRALLTDVEVLITDALRFTSHPTHMNFDEAIMLARQARARRTWFTHFQCQVSHAAAEEKLPPDIRPAYDGLRISLPLRS
jgi:phosphoribosyl 1,2-cyclic phosphate phosphodiesterase